MSDDITIGATREDYHSCQIYTRHYAKTFYFASHVLPREKRMAAYALYAFCRYADEIADSPEAIADTVHASHRLALLREQLGMVYSRFDVKDPRLKAFQATVMKYGIPQEYFTDLIRGVEMDLTKRRYQTFAELEDYCYCVASTVGLMMTKVFGAVQEQAALQHASDMGKAMQLTNILRDVGEDYRRNRIYLPAEEMHRFGVGEDELRQELVTAKFVALMKFQIERARVYYKSAAPGIPMITNDGSRFCVKLMSRTYARILDAIELNSYDTLHRRAHVPFVSKVGIACRSFFGGQLFPSNMQRHASQTIVPAVSFVQSSPESRYVP